MLNAKTQHVILQPSTQQIQRTPRDPCTKMYNSHLILCLQSFHTKSITLCSSSCSYSACYLFTGRRTNLNIRKDGYQSIQKELQEIRDTTDYKKKPEILTAIEDAFEVDIQVNVYSGCYPALNYCPSMCALGRFIRVYCVSVISLPMLYRLCRAFSRNCDVHASCRICYKSLFLVIEPS